MSLLRNVARFARSPQGKRLIEKGQRMARDPETRRKLDDARRRLATKR